MDAKEAATTRTNWEHKQRAADFDRAHAPEIPNPEASTARAAREARASREAENIGRATPRGSMAHAGANLRRRAPESGPAPTPVRQGARNAREDGPAPAAAAQGLGATRVNWTTRENMPAPESAGEHAHMRRHIRTELAEAEEALEKMPAQSTRASKQLEDKITWLKTQNARLATEGGDENHPAAVMLAEKLGLSPAQAEEARKLGYKIEGRSLKKGGQYATIEQLRHAIETSGAGPSGAPSSALAGHQNALEKVGGYSAEAAKKLAIEGFTVTKSAAGHVLFRQGGKKSSRGAAMYFLKHDVEE